MRVILSFLLSAFIVAFAAVTNAQDIDWKKVDEAIGRTATVSGDVHRYGFPRTDLNVTLDGVTIRPGIGAWRLVGVQARAWWRDGDG